MNERLLHQLIKDTLGQSVYEDFLLLPDEAKQEVVDIVTELQDGGESETLTKTWQEDFVRIPPTPEEFLTDPYYVGVKAKALYPKWREELLYVLDPKNNITEWLITGAIGTGKSFASIFAQAYKFAYLACLKNPQKFSGLADDTSIVFSVFNLTIDKTQITLYNDLKILLDTSPFFRETFPLRAVYGSRGHEQEVMMPKGVILIAGSKATHALSTNVYSCVLDEMNFRDSKNVRITYSDQSEAFKLYTNITRRITSRYVGFTPGLLCLISSRQTITDFLEEHIEKAKYMPHVHVSDFPLWKVKPAIAFPSGKTFKMIVGNRSHHRSSRILSDDEPAPSAEDYTVIDDIPVELKSSAILDPDGFIRDVAGAATYPSSPLISTKERIMDCTDATRSHPFDAQSLCLNIHTSDTIQDSLIHELIVRDTGSWGYEPLIEPNIPRALAVDLSRTGDSTGIAMGFPHSAKMLTVANYNPVTGLTEETTRLIWHYYYDFLLEIIPPPQGKGEIDFDKIEEWILYLSEELHYILDVVSFDGWQSDHMKQRLIKKGFNAVINSVDRTDIAYVELRQAITERRANFYEYEPFGPELGFLQHHRRGTKGATKGKVDHLKGKKKDVCDAAASVAYHCSMFPENNALVPPLGSSPFYREQRTQRVDREPVRKFLVDAAYEEGTTRGRKKRNIIGVK